MYEVRYRYFTRKEHKKEKHHVWIIAVLLYRHTVKPSEHSVKRLTYLFHNSVELFWLVSINMVRCIVYHLCREQIAEIRRIKIDGLCDTKLLHYKTNRNSIA